MRRIIPAMVEEKFEAVKEFADSDITFSKGMFGLCMLAAGLCGLVIGIFISPKGAKVQNITNNDKSRDSLDDMNDFWFDEDEFEDDADETESNELNGNRSKYIKL
ncbi:MAG: hypothetical protein IJT87_07325 [Ruminiclostridium sp.]|nr:hypothetical protein [Ruminiclostridium sp.]